MAVPTRAVLRGGDLTREGGGGRSSSSGPVGVGATQLLSKMASSGARVLTGPWATRLPLLSFSPSFFFFFGRPGAEEPAPRGAGLRCLTPHTLPSPITSPRPHPPPSGCGPSALVLRVRLHPDSAGLFFKNRASSAAVARRFSPLLSLFSFLPVIPSRPAVPALWV